MTDERRYASPAALERAIADRLAQRYPSTELQLRRDEIAYRRLVARMYEADPDRWVLKGGYAMILRLDPNRTSNDVDATYVADAAEHAVALEALQRAVDLDLDDFFSFEIVRVGEEDENRARRIGVLCRLGAREFARFRVDLAIPEAEIPTERVEAPPLTGVSEIDSIPPVLALAWPQQIADKVCAIFEEHSGRFSTRVRDLADLGLIADQVVGLEGGELIDALRAEEARRLPDTLPEGLPARFELLQDQQAEWEANFTSASRGAPITFEDALARAAALIDPLLNESARGKRWDPESRTYRES